MSRPQQSCQVMAADIMYGDPLSSYWRAMFYSWWPWQGQMCQEDMRQGRQCLWQNLHLCYDNMLKCIRLHSVTLSPSKCLPFCTLQSKSKHSEPRRWWWTCTGECWLQWRCEANIMLTLGTQIFYWCTFISRCNQCNTLMLMVQNWVRSGPGAVLLPLCKQGSQFLRFLSL